MKIFNIYIILVLLFLSGCKKDDTTSEITYAYHAHITDPKATAKKMGDTVIINVNFESHTGNTIHNINIKIYNTATQKVVFSKPASSLISEESGQIVLLDQVILNKANGFSTGAWTLKASVWAEKDGIQEEVEEVEFIIQE